MGTGSLPVVKRPGRGVEHPPSTSAEVKERVELYLYSLSGRSWPVLGSAIPLPFRFFTPNLYSLNTLATFNNIIITRLQNDLLKSVISGFRLEVGDNCDLLGCYASCSNS